VLQFLTESQPSIALLGHIHEAPRLTGNYMIQLGKTICVNPGGEHNENLQAVLINTDNLKIERRIVPYGI
jgi:Icc-related predicted phosphoesterase